jgi:hypothetical protein
MCGEGLWVIINLGDQERQLQLFGGDAGLAQLDIGAEKGPLLVGVVEDYLRAKRGEVLVPGEESKKK